MLTFIVAVMQQWWLSWWDACVPWYTRWEEGFISDSVLHKIKQGADAIAKQAQHCASQTHRAFVALTYVKRSSKTSAFDSSLYEAT